MFSDIHIMRFLACLFLLLICGHASGKLRIMENCGRSVQQESRIVGGRYVTKHGSYPWMVSMHQVGYRHICGASIINENLIVGAAHCFDVPIDPEDYYLFVGLHQLPHTNHWTVQRVEIKEIVIHEEYDNTTFHNDIAIMRPVKPIDMAKSKGYVNGICLPKTKKDPKGVAKVIGWGHTQEAGNNSDILQEVEVPIIGRFECNLAYDADPFDEYDEVIDTMICAGHRERSMDSCQNDSGGPLFQTDKNGVATLIGIVSHGAGCGKPDFPGVYTKVAAYTDWLEKHA